MSFINGLLPILTPLDLGLQNKDLVYAVIFFTSYIYLGDGAVSSEIVISSTPWYNQKIKIWRLSLGNESNNPLQGTN